MTLIRDISQDTRYRCLWVGISCHNSVRRKLQLHPQKCVPAQSLSFPVGEMGLSAAALFQGS